MADPVNMSEETNYTGKRQKMATGADVTNAQKIRHRGKFNTTEYIKGSKKRANAFCQRKHTPFNNARVFANLTKAKVMVSVQHEDGRKPEVYRSFKKVNSLSAAGETSQEFHNDITPLSPSFAQEKENESHDAEENVTVDEKNCRIYVSRQK
ncbi:uncharacterized protein LOC132736293 [Ruditapes philippinarum]|uniref:uncharacterized protein LOC132736293 n=1 Tax=Ruditapes philippinarum TaxID=129788 RepID=UPI00295B5CAD|nr:uncharacterized protein LOC132736293 [Ruditapes philippinarum]